MWSPGTFLHLRKEYVNSILGFSRSSTAPRATTALVIAIRETGFGTRGRKWDALLLINGYIFEVEDAWKKEDMFYVHVWNHK
jgi:hypothetical protein